MSRGPATPGPSQSGKGFGTLENSPSPFLGSATGTPSGSSGRSGGAVCRHCGLPCVDERLVSEAGAFCCLGCQTVHALLTENGLGQYYELGVTPGPTVRRAAKSGEWAYLDDPAVRAKLLDFTDGRQSRVTLHLPAIHCVACVWLLENLFRLHPGIGRAQVNFGRREAAITFAPEKLGLGELVSLLASLGYEPQFTLAELDGHRRASPGQRLHLQLGLAGFAFGNIMLFSLPAYFGFDSLSGPAFRWVFGWLSLALALPVVTFSAADYWRSAWTHLRQRVLTLDVPIALGLAAIYAQSLGEIISRRGEGYCDSLTGLIFFLLCGRLFQRRTYDRLAFDRDYKAFFPLAVVRRTAAGDEAVALSKLAVGDRLLLRHGELIPADSRLLGGDACIDYSFVTGESEPITKPPGEHLFAGGRQVGGPIEVQTVKPVSQSRLTSLWSADAFRKRRDDDLDSLTNRYSRRFTWLVLAVAVGAAAFWAFSDGARALKAFSSVLIVACPCALALAAPFTWGTAQRLLARIGVFLKGGLVLEHLASADTIVFDKTGTLTARDANTARFQGEALSDAEATWIATMARSSIHPNSMAIAATLGGTLDTPTVTGFTEVAGAGIAGCVAGHAVLLGSRDWLERNGIAVSGSAETSAVHVAIDGYHRGAFAVANRLRPEVEELIRELGGRYELALLSGDNERERDRYRELFGADARVQFHQMPADKLAFVRQLQESGRRVIMIGDGLNDAGALKQADVGVAVVESIGAFSPASDVILDAAQLPRLGGILRFARRARSVVRGSFAISSAYNVVGVSIAAAGLLAPIVCAILMPLSSLTVVLFACGLTQWIARRNFGSPEVTRRGEPAQVPMSAAPELGLVAPEGGRL